jgi:hypothetical protein
LPGRKRPEGEEWVNIHVAVLTYHAEIGNNSNGYDDANNDHHDEHIDDADVDKIKR